MLLLGCASTVTATRIRPPPRPLVARDPSSVLVLAGEPPAEPHVKVALLQLDPNGSRGAGGAAQMIRRLREKAAELGCDAVSLESTAPPLASCVVFTPPDSSRDVEAEIANTPRK
ncbi:MAG TPA: hypothetical protein VFS67_15740 [Polyangiaceae bacterium]|nr:hypothetical protein [Polyangiaceae bacterium]